MVRLKMVQRVVTLNMRSRVPRKALNSLCVVLALLVSTVSGGLSPSTSLADNLPVISAGTQHSCALTSLSGGGVRCWGENLSGQLGDGTFTDRWTPTDVPGLSGVSAIAAGGTHTCALIASNRGVVCWGGNAVGQLGNGTGGTSLTPVSVLDVSSTPITGVVSISAGLNHTCALFETGGVQCWGWGVAGQLGDGSFSSRNYAADVSGYTSGVSRISAGKDHTCLVVSASHEVKCFGGNMWGALGDGTTTNRGSPVSVVGIPSTAQEIASGNGLTCAKLQDGSLRCWGANGSGSVGDGTDSETAAPVTVSYIGTDGALIAAGGYESAASADRFACATLNSTGQVMCWGRGNEGQLGNGGTFSSTTPTLVSAISGAVALVTGNGHACAWIGTCTVKCWGENTQGSVGDGTQVNKSTPVTVLTCAEPTATPTPEVVPTTAPGLTPTPDACSSEKSCVPDGRLTTPLAPRAPEFVATPVVSGSLVSFAVGEVKLGVPIEPAKQKKLRTRLQKFFGTKIKSLSSAIRFLRVFYVISIVPAKKTQGMEIEAEGLSTRYKLDTRKRRVTVRLSPGTYTATVSVRLKDSRGRTFANGKPSPGASFVVK